MFRVSYQHLILVSASLYAFFESQDDSSSVLTRQQADDPPKLKGSPFPINTCKIGGNVGVLHALKEFLNIFLEGGDLITERVKPHLVAIITIPQLMGIV